MAERSGTNVSAMVAGRAFPIVMGVVGVAVAGLVAAMPQASLDLLMWRLGLPHVIAAATPPIGVTGRTLLAVAAMLPFVGVAMTSWLWDEKLSLLKRRPQVVRAKARLAEATPTIRRADAHPDAAPRRPIRAAEDLGEPLPIKTISVTRGVPEPEQPLPRNLDQPLAAFDPIAIPDVPRDPVRAVAPLVPTPPVAPESEVALAWGGDAKPEEPVLSFLAMAPEPEPEPQSEQEPEAKPTTEALPAKESAPVAEATMVPAATDIAEEAAQTVPARPPADAAFRREPIEPAVARPEEASIASLLDRLERGARKKAVPAEEPQKAETLDDTLVMLRRLAAG